MKNHYDAKEPGRTIYQRERIDNLSKKIKDMLAINNNGGAYDFLRTELPKLENDGLLNKAEVAEFLIKIQEDFFTRRDFGLAAEIVKAASEELLNVGQNEKAAEAYFDFAGKLFESGQYGWAGSRYYNAAIIFIVNGNLEKARAYLEQAWQRFKEFPNEFWTSKLEKHLEILKPTKDIREKLIQLSQLQLDFRDMSRENWVEACKAGSLKLVKEAVSDEYNDSQHC